MVSRKAHNLEAPVRVGPPQQVNVGDSREVSKVMSRL